MKKTIKILPALLLPLLLTACYCDEPYNSRAYNGSTADYSYSHSSDSGYAQPIEDEMYAPTATNNAVSTTNYSRSTTNQTVRHR